MINTKFKVIKPPYGTVPDNDTPRVFLAGSIEMGVAEDWQVKFTKEVEGLRLVVMNPRRDNWDPTWVQSIDNSNFSKQVYWELNNLDLADHIVMYFDPNTKSPISLLELGLYATTGKLIVCCPPGFWRKGNVDIVCEKYDIPVFETLDEMIEEFFHRLPAQFSEKKTYHIPKDAYFQGVGEE